MTLSDLFIVCSHGRRSAHEYDGGWNDWTNASSRKVEWCPGGRPATLEDLGGESIEWCDEHGTPVAARINKKPKVCWAIWCDDALNQLPCSFVERILIPLPQMVAGESL